MVICTSDVDNVLCKSATSRAGHQEGTELCTYVSRITQPLPPSTIDTPPLTFHYRHTSHLPPTQLPHLPPTQLPSPSTHTAPLTFHPHNSPHLPPTHLLSPSTHTHPSPSTYTPLTSTHAVLTFHTWNDSGSTTVGWTISLPGKTPQVTAIGVAVQFVMSSDPWKWLNQH